MSIVDRPLLLAVTARSWPEVAGGNGPSRIITVIGKLT